MPVILTLKSSCSVYSKSPSKHWSISFCFVLCEYEEQLTGNFLILKTVKILDTRMTVKWLFNLSLSELTSFPQQWRNIFLHEAGCGTSKALFWQFYITECILIEIKYLVKSRTGGLPATSGLPARRSCWNALCASLTPGHAVSGNLGKESRSLWLCGQPLREQRPRSVKSEKCCGLEQPWLTAATSCLPAPCTSLRPYVAGCAWPQSSTQGK